jgi:hypothetical protein
MYDDLRTYSSKDDVIIFQHNEQTLIGEILSEVPPGDIKVLLFIYVTEEIRSQYSLSSVTTEEAPFAIKSSMVEVIKSTTTLVIERSSIIDIAFVIPLMELEGGMVHLTGAANSFFVRYQQHIGGYSQDVSFRLLRPRNVEPFSFRIF